MSALTDKQKELGIDADTVGELLVEIIQYPHLRWIDFGLQVLDELLLYHCPTEIGKEAVLNMKEILLVEYRYLLDNEDFIT